MTRAHASLLSTRPIPARERLIVALDVPGLNEAEPILEKLHGVVSTFKIGSQLFTAAGPTAVELVRKRGGRVFLDLKFHDIPNTVAGAVREAARLGVFMLNVHASGGSGMLKAAADALREARDKGEAPLLIAVTLLTSLDRATLQRELHVPLPVEAQVLHLAGLAKAAGLDGCVASPHEILPLRNALGRDFVIVTPGVRPAGSGVGDHARSATPEAAIKAGADYLVVGRPILEAEDPAAMAETIIDSITESRR